MTSNGHGGHIRRLFTAEYMSYCTSSEPEDMDEIIRLGAAAVTLFQEQDEQ